MNEKIFIDTSGFVAIADAQDEFHQQAGALWKTLVSADSPVFTTNYIVLETTAILQARCSFETAERFQNDILPFADVCWIDQNKHTLAFESWSTARRRKLSLTDCTSFIIMRELSISRAFAFDRHFREQGFVTVPTMYA